SPYWHERFPKASPPPPSSNALFQTFLVDLPREHVVGDLSSLEERLKWYVTDVQIFRCPSDDHLLPRTSKVADAGQNSYSCAHGLTDDKSPTSAILCDSLAPNKAPHGKAGQNVVYADGHGEWRTDAPDLKDRLDPKY